MSCRDILVDPPVVVHTSVKGKSVPSPILPASYSSNAQSISEPVLKQPAPKVVDLSTEKSGSNTTIPTILSFAFDSTAVRFFFELSEMEFTLAPTSDSSLLKIDNLQQPQTIFKGDPFSPKWIDTLFNCTLDKSCAVLISKPLFDCSDQTVYRQAGRIYSESPGQVCVQYAAGKHLDFSASSVIEMYDYSFSFEDSVLFDVKSLSPTHFFDTSPANLARWLDGYYQLLKPTTIELYEPTFTCIKVETGPKPAVDEISELCPPETNFNQPSEANDPESLQQPPDVCPLVQKELTQTPVVGPAKRAKRHAEIPDQINCDVVGTECKEVPTFFRAGKSFPQRCKQHKTPDMSERKEKLPTKIVPFEKKKSTKNVPAESSSTLEALFGVASESSPTKKVKFACKVANCPKPAKYAHKDEVHDDPVMCEKHASGVTGTYKPVSAPL